MNSFAPRRRFGISAAAALGACFVLASALAEVRAAPVSYVANIETAVGNPITDLLILEEDSAGLVHSAVFGSSLPGYGTSVIGHTPSYEPVNSLIIGLTEGVDAAGAPKTQIVAFLDDAFAAANLGKKWSQVFVGTRHSVTITNLQAAVTGDATQQAWFTETFYPGPAAGATFATGGSFTVAEFTNLDIGGSSAVNGNWMINSLGSGSIANETNTENREAFLINETAKVDLGPFDIELALETADTIGVNKTVLNDTGADWNSFVMELGTTVDGAFVPSTDGDGLGFLDSADYPIREETGAFPGVVIEEDRLVFSGFLADGDTANFIAFIQSNTQGNHKFTLRQYVPTAPEPGTFALAMLALPLFAIRRRRHRS